MITYDMRELERDTFRDEGHGEIRRFSDERFLFFISVDDSLSICQDVICDVVVLSAKYYDSGIRV